MRDTIFGTRTLLRGLVLGLLLAVVACAPKQVVLSPNAGNFKPKTVSKAAVGMMLVRPMFAADTLVSTVTWVNPASDGKGPLDSLKVQLSNFSLPGGWLPAVKFTGTFPTTAVFRQALPFQDATWIAAAQICTYRGLGTNSATCVSVNSAPYVYVLSAPPAVTGATVTNVKVP